jgi:CxxC-x17-CxxC domain-containing protein
MLAMGSFNRSFVRRDFGDKKKAGSMMHKTICSKCSKECEVPFRPTGNRPVYCKECFQTMRPEATRPDNNFSRHPNFERRSGEGNRFAQQPQYKEQFESLNVKLDKILEILESKAAISADVKAVEIKIPKVKKATRKSAVNKEK